MTQNSESIDAIFDQAEAHPELFEQTVKAGAVDNINHDEPLKKDQAIYGRLGGIVRQLHDSLRELGYEHIFDETLKEITNSQGRLEYIASLTEQAANRVLNAVDASMPILDHQVVYARRIEGKWADMLAGKLDSAEIALLATESQDFARDVIKNSEEEKAKLMEIMMAQDFQDITGQIINKVVNLTQKLESELAEILRDYAPVSLHEKAVDLLAGPAVPNQAMVQDDVDSLLDDLGF